jgi:hypothetical protein
MAMPNAEVAGPPIVVGAELRNGSAAPRPETTTVQCASYNAAKSLAAHKRRSHVDLAAYAVFVIALGCWCVKSASPQLP